MIKVFIIVILITFPNIALAKYGAAGVKVGNEYGEIVGVLILCAILGFIFSILIAFGTELLESKSESEDNKVYLCGFFHIIFALIIYFIFIWIDKNTFSSGEWVVLSIFYLIPGVYFYLKDGNGENTNNIQVILLSITTHIVMLLIVISVLSGKDDNKITPTNQIKEITNPSSMDVQCNSKYPGTFYNKENDKCICPGIHPNNWDAITRTCPEGGIKYSQQVRNLEQSYCYFNGKSYRLPYDAHCTPYGNNNAWRCNEGFFEAWGQGQAQGQQVCVNNQTNMYNYYID